MGDFGDMAQKVGKLAENLEDDIDNDMASESANMAQTAAANLAANNSVTASDPLVTKVHAAKTSLPNEFTTYRVTAPTKYAKFLEYGTGMYGRFKAPSSPPTMQIYEWILSKGIQPTSPNIDDQWGLANAIAATIATYGSKAHPFMIPAFRVHRPQYRNSISNTISRTTKRTIR